MNKIQYNKGFTLVEMIVSLGIFTIVALVAVGALMKIMDANKKSIALKTAVNNMNFTLESISREMRVGSNYYCESVAFTQSTLNSDTSTYPTTCQPSASYSGNWVIAFNSSKTHTKSSGGTCHLIYEYKYIAKSGSTPASLQKAQQRDCETAISSGDFQDIISSEVNIDNSIITVNNSTQPYATFFFHGTSGAKLKDQAEFTVQTSVSQRLPK